MKRYASSLLLMLSLACASSPMQSSSGMGGAALASRAIDAPQYILLDAPNQIRNAEHMSSVYPLYIAGTLTNKGFMPAGNIQGHGKLCAEGKDWFSLTDLSIHKGGDGATPVAPYVPGCATTSGFQPSSREIVTQ